LFRNKKSLFNRQAEEALVKFRESRDGRSGQGDSLISDSPIPPRKSADRPTGASDTGERGELLTSHVKF
jgi:hypothetical protein